jgi:regulator of protease activity HflC (stomatin/prohibitin superfamily)
VTFALIAFATVAALLAAILLFSRGPAPPLVPIVAPPVGATITANGKPTTVDAVIAWEIVRERLAANAVPADAMASLDQTIAPKLFEPSLSP